MGNMNLMVGAIMSNPRNGLEIANEQWYRIVRICLVCFSSIVIVLLMVGMYVDYQKGNQTVVGDDGYNDLALGGNEEQFANDDDDGDGEEQIAQEEPDDGTRGVVVYDPEDLSVLNVVLVHLTDTEPVFYDILEAFCPPEIRRSCIEAVMSGGAGDWGSGIITYTVDDSRPLQEAVFLLLEQFPLVLADESAWACGCVGEPTPTGQLMTE